MVGVGVEGQCSSRAAKPTAQPSASPKRSQRGALTTTSKKNCKGFPPTLNVGEGSHPKQPKRGDMERGRTKNQGWSWPWSQSRRWSRQTELARSWSWKHVARGATRNNQSRGHNGEGEKQKSGRHDGEGEISCKLVGVGCVVRQSQGWIWSWRRRRNVKVENKLEGSEPPAVRVRGRGWIPRNERR